MFERFVATMRQAARFQSDPPEPFDPGAAGMWSITPPTPPAEPTRNAMQETLDSLRAQFGDVEDDRRDWQKLAWRGWRRVPEVRAAVTYRANASRRIRLFIGEVPHDGTDPTPLPDSPANDPYIAPLYDLLGGPLQQQRLQAKWSTYMDIPGECLIIAIRLTHDERTRLATGDEWLWDIQSAASARDGGTVDLCIETERGVIRRRIRIRPDGTTDLPDDVVMIHHVNSDPEHAELADSPSRALLDDVETLTNVADSVNAGAISRLVLDGLLVFAPEVTVPGRGDGESGDEVLLQMARSAEAALQHRRTAKAAQPGILRTSLSASDVPVRDQVAHIEVGQPYRGDAITILDWFARRIAIGYNVPVEVVQGSQDTNHWNALFEGQDGARIGIGPAMADLCGILYRGFVVRQYQAAGLDPARYKRLTLWWDASALTQDPDRSATVIDMYKTDSSLVTRGEVRQAAGLSEEPDTDTTPTALPAPGSASGGTPGLIRPTPSIPGGAPAVRNPGFPSPAGRR